MTGDDDGRSTTKVPVALMRQLASDSEPPPVDRRAPTIPIEERTVRDQVHDLDDDTPWEEPAVRLTSREAVARALELLAAAWRAGHVVSFSLHAEITGVSRMSVAYAADAPAIDLGELAVPEG